MNRVFAATSPDGRSATASPRCSGHKRSRSSATDTGAPESPRHGQARHDLWKAGCAETCTSGSEGGPGKRTGGDTGTAPRSDPYYQHTGDRRDLKLAIRALRRELKPILRRYAGKAARYRHSRGFAKNLIKIWPALWTFAAKPGVQPTNNHAERSLRGAVIARKLSLGSQSEEGEKRIARPLSAHTTCRLQARSLHAYLIDLLAAHARGDRVPLLA